MLHDPRLRRLALILILAATAPTLAGCRRPTDGRPANPGLVDSSQKAARAEYAKVLVQFDQAVAIAVKTHDWVPVVDLLSPTAGNSYTEQIAPDLRWDGLKIIGRAAELALPDIRALAATAPGRLGRVSGFSNAEGVSPEVKAEYKTLGRSAGRSSLKNHDELARAAEARGDLVSAAVLFASAAQGDWRVATNVKPLLQRGLEAARPTMAWRVPPDMQAEVEMATWPTWMDRADAGQPGDSEIEIVASKLAITSGKTPTMLSVAVGSEHTSTANDKVGPLDAEVAKWTKLTKDAARDVDLAPFERRARAEAHLDDVSAQLRRATIARGRESATIESDREIRQSYDAVELWTTVQSDVELHILVPGHAPIVATRPVSATVSTYTNDAVPALGVERRPPQPPSATSARRAWHEQAAAQAIKLFDKTIGGRYGLALAAARSATKGSTARTEKIYVACMMVDATKCYLDGIGHELRASGLPDTADAWNIVTH